MSLAGVVISCFGIRGRINVWVWQTSSESVEGQHYKANSEITVISVFKYLNVLKTYSNDIYRAYKCI